MIQWGNRHRQISDKKEMFSKNPRKNKKQKDQSNGEGLLDSNHRHIYTTY